jgi:phosphoglycerate dehydrogenase-like enzyme
MTCGILLLGNEPIGQETLTRIEKKYKTIVGIMEGQENHEIQNAWIDLSVNVDENFFQKFSKVKNIICCATGSTNIKHELLEKYDVKLFNLRTHKSFLTEISATAEHAWALLLAVHSRIIEANELVRAGKWDKRSLQRRQLKGTQLGIIGYGRLGKIIGTYGSAFGMNVVFSDLEHNKVVSMQQHMQVDLEQLVRGSDYIILSSSVTPEHNEILNSTLLELIKPGMSLINISRGVLVDESKILELLELGKMQMYATDVVRLEDVSTSRARSIETYHSLVKHERVILTPHMGGYCSDVRQSCEIHLIDYLTEGTCSCE